MKIKEYIKSKQPLLYRTFFNALKNNELSHAYLIVGETGTPLKETAIYLAKSLLCDNPQPLACENCITCLRIDNNQYADLIIEDGEKETIKREEVDRIISTFSKTAIEAKGKVIYIIHLIETLQPVSINALLKFLEEPGKDTYAFLTTQNESRVLPTIVSRSQKLVLRLTPREEIIAECKNLSLPEDDIELLSYFYNDANKIKEVILNEDYADTKKCLNIFLSNASNSNDLLFTIDNKIIKDITTKQQARVFLDMLTSVFEDVIRKKNSEKIFLNTYDKIINELAKQLPHVESSLLEIISLRRKIDSNVNIPSIFEHLAIYLTKEQ
ncbi:MAG: hypothetical protein MJ208_01070 [Bacilli bacterium]|nr:hypothetical protein [Bacilli bacterium]